MKHLNMSPLFLKIPLSSLFLVFFALGCASPEVLQYGTRMGTVQKEWGKPDETMAFQDYRAKGYYSSAGLSGSWSRDGGSVSGFEVGQTYTPTKIVWAYKDKGKALFFEKRGLLFDEQHTAVMVWKLVGWESLGMKPDQQSPKPSATAEKATGS